MALSVDGAEDALAMRDTYSLEFPVLYDADAAVTRQWGLFDLLGDGVSAPATFVIRTDGTVETSLVGATISDRPATDSILDVLASLAGIDRAAMAGAGGDPPGPEAAPPPGDDLAGMLGLGTGDSTGDDDSVDGMGDAPVRRATPEPATAGAPAVGDLAPGFSLPTAQGQVVALDDYIEEQNVVLVFFRAWW